MLKKRITAAVLIIFSCLWFFVICGFSGENSDVSDKTSGRVTNLVLSFCIKGFSELSESEKDALTAKYNPIIRKLAHFTEYAVLGVLISFVFMCFEQTKKRFCLLSLLLSFISASADELHQFFVPGRACRFTDILIDTSGAASGIFAVFILLLFIKAFKTKKTL